MKLLDLRIMRGPNYWSVHHPRTIVLKIDLEELDHVRTNELPGFMERLQHLLPGLFTSIPGEEPLADRLRRGIGLTEIVTRVALELQIAAGIPVHYGKCYPAQEPGTCFSVFEYTDEYVGEYAGEEAVYLTEDLARNQPYDIGYTLQRIREIMQEGQHEVPDMAVEPAMPVIAVTGTNGKTTTTRLIAHMARVAGYQVGNTSSDGIYLNGHLLEEGDTTGYLSAQTILLDREVNFAVLECARGGILKSGLAFLHADIGVVTNVAADHLGLKDIHTIEEMAEVKSVVVRAVKPSGFAILNADDELVLAMREKLFCNVALYSLNPANPTIAAHIAAGGLTAVLDNDTLCLYQNSKVIQIETAAAIPLTMGGRARFNTANALAAILAGFAAGFPLHAIRKGLCTFIPSAEHTPGRMNVFKFPGFEVLIDYAHNAHGMKALGGFLDATEATQKVGIIAVMGDRRPEDILMLGSTAASLFDTIIIRENEDFRDRTFDQIRELLQTGIDQVKPNAHVLVINNELEAIRFAIEQAVPGAFITIISENIPEAIALVQHLQKQFQEVA